MRWFWELNLIHCLDVYLVVIFLVATCLRIHQYWSLLALISSMHECWPYLLKLVNQHRGIFLTWGTVLPALLAFLLSLGHMLACRLVWPQVDVTIAQVVHWWPVAVAVGSLGAVMIGFDCYAAWQVGKWDHAQVRKQLDQAEHWLASWTAPALHVLTLGFINPRKLVRVEVRRALEKASQQLNSALWWRSLPIGLRIASGGSLWLTYVWVVR